MRTPKQQLNDAMAGEWYAPIPFIQTALHRQMEEEEMKEVAKTIFVTDDGQEFADRGDAIRHEVLTEIYNLLENQSFVVSESSSENVSARNDIAKFIQSNWLNLVAIMDQRND